MRGLWQGLFAAVLLIALVLLVQAIRHLDGLCVIDGVTASSPRR
jgi:hypothetical protein